MISIGETLRLAGRALRRNKLRSFLTTLGIIIGVGAVIFIQSIGEGAKSRVRAQIESAGTNIVMLFSGASQGPGGRGGAGSQPTITWEDLRAIQTELPSVRAVAPQINSQQPVISETNTWNTQITGTTPDFFTIRNWPVSAGALFTASDQASAAKNAVIGQTAAENLFGPGVDPIGQIVRIRDAPFTIVGVLERKGQNAMGTDQDDCIFIPLSAFQTRMQRGLGKFVPGRISISAVSPEAIPVVRQEVAQLLRERHRLGPDDEDDFSTSSMAEMTSMLTSTQDTMTLLLSAIALVSLVVGGIGVMNIMLVSVTERTREIGIRMAVGAQPTDIMMQFLVEALVLSAVGGALGVIFGVGLGQVIAPKFGWTMETKTQIVFVSLAVSAGVGILFGLYPARKASRLDPIDALRYE
ncbi:MAG TPA: ABC transporter permease [Steroidobacteraceae bacterium]|jgi:putative ABC transport system permease protein|nr:ABC transporter permease [Steroidobacteraceae bacterium]